MSHGRCVRLLVQAKPAAKTSGDKADKKATDSQKTPTKSGFFDPSISDLSDLTVGSAYRVKVVLVGPAHLVVAFHRDKAYRQGTLCQRLRVLLVQVIVSFMDLGMDVCVLCR